MNPGKVRSLRQVKAAEMAERRAQVWELRLGGASIRQIAKAVACGTGTVVRDLRATFQQLDRDSIRSAESWRNLLIARFERVYLDAMCSKERDSLHVAVRATREQGLLLGLYRPDDEIEVEADDDKSVTLEIVEDPLGLGGNGDVSEVN